MADYELTQATALTIGYTIREQRHEFRVSQPEQVREVLDTIEVTGTAGGQVGLDPFGWVHFHFADGAVVRTCFVQADRLDRAYGGQVYLDRKFYDKVCALASAHAGRPINVLVNNH